MIDTIYIAAAVEKQLGLLEKSSKKGILASAQYRLIVEKLLQGDLLTTTLFLKRTKHGEQRLKGCIKYDLGGGYRLITIKDESRLFIVFIGSHDEADSWLEKNKGNLSRLISQGFTTSLPVHKKETQQKESVPAIPHADEEDDYDTLITGKISDTILKDVFCGLFASSK